MRAASKRALVGTLLSFLSLSTVNFRYFTQRAASSSLLGSFLFNTLTYVGPLPPVN